MQFSSICVHFLLLCLEKSVFPNTSISQAKQIIDGVSLLSGTINLDELSQINISLLCIADMQVVFGY